MLVKRVLDDGGSIIPLFVPAEHTGGTGLCNPSVLVEEDRVLVNIRHVQYSLYHAEFDTKYPSRWGPLTYMHPEDDLTLRTVNYLAEFTRDLELKSLSKIDTSNLDVPPIWTFIGLEDGRLVNWNDKNYLIGVRRDTKDNGEGRMEYSELEFTDAGVKEVSRTRIESPAPSYCEKNWMPVLNKPNHFVKWSNPVEVVEADLETGTSKTVFQGTQKLKLPRDLRGSSQVVEINKYYVAITHETDFWYDEYGYKNAKYYHRFVVWDLEWNFVKVTKPFKFMDGWIEFCTGMDVLGNSILITFGFQDNTAYLLKAPLKTIIDFINNEHEF